MKTRCFLRKGFGDPDSLQGWLGQVQRGNSLSSLPTSCRPPPPIPLHSSRHAAIGLLLHDCTPHKVLRPSCLQRSLKFPSPTSLPSSLRGMLWSLPQRTYCRCATATSSTTTKQAGPRSLVPKDKDGPILMVQVLHPADPLPLGADPSPQTPGPAGIRHTQQSQGGWHYVQTHLVALGSAWLPVSDVPELSCSNSALTPFPISLIPATPRVGRQLGQASACGSLGHKGRRRYPLNFFKGLTSSTT